MSPYDARFLETSPCRIIVHGVAEGVGLHRRVRWQRRRLVGVDLVLSVLVDGGQVLRLEQHRLALEALDGHGWLGLG